MLLGLLASGAIARAVIVKWDGGGGSTSWNNMLNWVGDFLPTGADDVVLDNSATTLPPRMTLDANFTVRSLQYGSPFAPLSIEADALVALSRTLTIPGDGTALISATGGTPGGGYLTIEGPNRTYANSNSAAPGVINNSTPLNLVLAGAGALNASAGSMLAVLADTSSSITLPELNVTGGGRVYLGGRNAFAVTAPIAVSGGTRLVIQNDYNLGAETNTVAVGGGGASLSFADNTTAFRAIRVVGGDGRIDVAFTKSAILSGTGFTTPDTSTLTKTGQGVFYLVTPTSYQGAIVIAPNGGTFSIRASSQYNTAPNTAAGYFAADVARLEGVTEFTINPSSTLQTENRNGIVGFPNSGNGNGGNLNLGDRFADTIPITMKGGTLQFVAADSTSVRRESFGVITLAEGLSTFTASANNQGAEIETANLIRTLGATLNAIGSNSLGTSGNNGRIILNQLNGVAPPASGLLGGWAIVNSLELAAYLPYASGAGGIGAFGNTGAGYPAYASTLAPGNVAALSATTALPPGGATTSALKFSGSGTNITYSAATDVLNLESGGLLLDNNAHSISTTANTGRLTAGGAASTGTSELFLHVLGNTTTINAQVIDNPAGAKVALVKDFGGAVTLAGTNNYSGGTFITNSGDINANTNTGSALGRGPVFISNARIIFNNSAAQVDATTTGWNLTTNPTYRLVNQGQLQSTSNTAFPSGQTIVIDPTSVLVMPGTTFGNSLGIGPQLSAAPGAVLGEAAAGVLNAFITANGASAPTTPTWWFGTSVSAGTNLAETITIGPGTPWLGISTDRFARGIGSSGAVTTITANGDFSLRGMNVNGTGLQLTFGNGGGATGAMRILPGTQGAGAAIKVTIPEGTVSLNNDQSQYAGVTFIVGPGATLLTNVATSLGGGSGTTPANVIVQTGATLNSSATANTINGNVFFEPGGRLLADDGTTNAFSGAGTLTFARGGIIDVTAQPRTAITGTQTFATSPGTILRTSQSDVIGISTRLGPDLNIEATGNVSLTGQTTAANTWVPEDITLTTRSSGGGVITNDTATRIINNNTGGTIRVGTTNAAALAATSGTTLQFRDDFVLGPNQVMNIGSLEQISGNMKLGRVTFEMFSNNRGDDTSILRVLDGAQLVNGGNGLLPHNIRLDLPGVMTTTGVAGVATLPNTGSTLLLAQSYTETVAELTGPGALLSNVGVATGSILGGPVLQVTGRNANYTLLTNVSSIANSGNLPVLAHIGTGTATYRGVTVPTTDATPRAGALAAFRGTLVLDGTTPQRWPLLRPAKGGTIILDDRTGGSLGPNQTRFGQIWGLGGELIVDGPTTGTAIEAAAANAANTTALRNDTYAHTTITVKDNGGTVTLNLGILPSMANNDALRATHLFRGPGLAGVPSLLNAAGVITVPGSPENALILTATPNMASNAANNVGGDFQQTDGNTNSTTTGTIPGSNAIVGAIGRPLVAIKPEIIADDSPTGLGKGFATIDSAETGWRLLANSEYTSSVISDYRQNTNVRIGGALTLSGDTMVQSLTLNNGAAIAAGTSSPLTQHAPRLHVMSGGIFVPTGASASIGGVNLTAPAGQPLFIHALGDLTLSSYVFTGAQNSGFGNAGIVKNGAGTLTFSSIGAVRDLTGSWTLNDGTIDFGLGNQFGVIYSGQQNQQGNSNLIVNGGTFRFAGGVQRVLALSNNNPLPGFGGTITATAPTALVVDGGGLFSGNLSGQLRLVKAGTNTAFNEQMLTGANDLTGGVEVRAGTLRLRDDARFTQPAPFAINAGTLFFDNTGYRDSNGGYARGDRVNPSSSIALRGGNIQLWGTPEAAGVTQPLAASGGAEVRLVSGQNTMTVIPGGSSHAVLQLGNLTRNAGSTVNFSATWPSTSAYQLGAAGTGKSQPRIVIDQLAGVPFSQATLDDGIVGGWAWVEGAHFANYKDGQGVGAMSNLTFGFSDYSSTNLNAAGATDNVNITALVTMSAGNRTVNSVRTQNSIQFTNAADVLTLATGGYIGHTNSINIGASVGSGVLTSGGPELFFHTTSTVTVNSTIANGVSTVSIVKDGSGTIVLAGNNSYTGTTYVNGGTVQLNNTSANGTTNVAIRGPIIVQGGNTSSTNATTGANITLSRPDQILDTIVPELRNGGTITLNGLVSGGGTLFTLPGLKYVAEGSHQNTSVTGTGNNGTLVLTGQLAIDAQNDAPTSVPLISSGLSGGVTFGGPAGTAQDIRVNALAPTELTQLIGMFINTRINAAPSGVADGGLRKTGPGQLLLGGASTGWTQGLNIFEGSVRADGIDSLGPINNFTTVQPGAALLLGNGVNGLRGSVRLKGGLLGSENGTTNVLGAATTTVGSATVLEAFAGTTSTIKVADFVNDAGYDRDITFNGQLTGSGNLTLVGPTVANALSLLTTGNIPNTGTQTRVGVFRLANPIQDDPAIAGITAGANDFSGTITIGVNTVLLAQGATGTGLPSRTNGNLFGTGTINLAGGLLQIREDLATDGSLSISYGNAFTLSGNSFINADRANGGSSSVTINFGRLTVPSGAHALTVSNGNSYRVGFTQIDGAGTLIKAGVSNLNIGGYAAGFSGNIEVAGASGRYNGPAFGLTFTAGTNNISNLTVRGSYQLTSGRQLNVTSLLDVPANPDNGTAGAVNIAHDGTFAATVVRNNGRFGFAATTSVGTGVASYNITRYRGNGLVIANDNRVTLNNTIIEDDGATPTTLRVAGDNVVVVNGTAHTHTGGTEVQSGTLRLTTSATNPLGTAPIRVLGYPASSVGLDSIPVSAAGGTLEFAATNITQDSSITNSGTVRVASGTTTINGSINGTATTFRAGLLEGRLDSGVLDASGSRPGNNGLWGLVPEPRMGQMNLVTQNPITGWADNEVWIYTGHIFDPDGKFSFIEMIDDQALVVVDGRPVLHNTAAGDPSASGYTTGYRDRTPLQNSNVAANAGMTDFSGSGVGGGWHTIEIRFSNGAGNAGPATIRNGFGNSFGFGLNRDGAGALDAADYIRPIDPGDMSLFRTPVGGRGDIAVSAGATLNASGFTLIDDVSLAADVGGAAFNVNTAGTSDAVSVRATGTTGSATLNLAAAQLVDAQHLNVAAGTTLRKNGAGTLTFAASQAIDGTFQVNAGTVSFAGAGSGAGGVEVNNAGTVFNLQGGISGAVANVGGGVTLNSGSLTGSGRIGGPLNATGGLVSPGGNSSGRIFSGDLTLGAGADVLFQLGGLVAGSGYDQMNVTGAVTLAGDAMFGLLGGFTPVPGDIFHLILNDGVEGVNGTFAGYSEGAPVSIGAFSFTLSYEANGDGGGIANDVALLTVPEPGSLASLLTGLGVLAMWRSRKARTQ